MNIAALSAAARELKQRWGEADPFRLAEAMQICISLQPLGSYDGCCKGFFISHRRIKHITINCDLPEQLQRVILAHELGHAVLHARQQSCASFHDLTLFQSTDQREYEANIFAAELLLSDEAVAELLQEQMPFFQTAALLCVPPEILDFKFRILKDRGISIQSPIISNGDFLKNLDALSYR